MGPILLSLLIPLNLPLLVLESFTLVLPKLEFLIREQVVGRLVVRDERLWRVVVVVVVMMMDFVMLEWMVVEWLRVDSDVLA